MASRASRARQHRLTRPSDSLNIPMTTWGGVIQGLHAGSSVTLVLEAFYIHKQSLLLIAV
jgi:hypothetical protein